MANVRLTARVPSPTSDEKSFASKWMPAKLQAKDGQDRRALLSFGWSIS
jgi:hypothetical protein